MPHPRIGYKLKDGTKVPGVTSILSRFKDSQALIYWGWQRGKEGLELYDSRDKAAELGTIVHSMAEDYIKGCKQPIFSNIGLSETDIQAVCNAFGAFEEWFESNKFQPVAQEIQLVSETYSFGGTFDLVARDYKNRLCMIDFKTSDGVYQEYLAQIAAYRILWNENNPDNQLTGGSHLCRFAKTHGDFAHYYYPDLSDAERLFILLREAYDLDKELKRRC